jgi:hypothetical protein
VVTAAFPVAATGAIYPVAFAAIVTMLGGANPLRRSLAFLAGGWLASAIGFVIVIVVLQSFHLTPRTHPNASGTIKIALGAVLLALAVRLVLLHRHPAPETAPVAGRDAAAKGAVAEGHSLRRSFITGLLVYIPGVFLIASAKTVADAHAPVVSTYVSAFICVVLLLAIVEVPIVAFAIWPDRVRPSLEGTVAWAHNHSYGLILAIELVVGVYLVVGGIDAIATH